MALNWITPEGTLANFLIGESSTTEIISTGLNVTYNVVGGELPPGLTLTTVNRGTILSPDYVGVVSGTPQGPQSNANFTSLTYSFVVRALDSVTGEVIYGTFKIITTNTVNGDFYWITPAGNLGTVPSDIFYQLNLQVYSSTPVTYSFISGELPPGMQVVKTGRLQGVPTVLKALAVNESQTYRFTIRATNTKGQINDQSFNLTVTNVFGPIIRPTDKNLGSHFDGTYFSQKLRVNESNPNIKIQWSLEKGELPPGLALDQNGLISGYIQPLILSGDYGPPRYDSYITDPKNPDVIIERAPYDGSPYAFEISQTRSYAFTVQAFDGANYDLQDYVVRIISRSGFTADNTSITADDDFLTVDSGNVYIPIILNAPGNLPIARQDSYYAYKFDGYDFQGDTLSYFVSATLGTFDSFVSGYDEGFDYAPFDSYDDRTSATSNLPGVILDSKSGWLYGKVSPQTTNIQTYSFGLYVTKTRDGIEYRSQPVFFNFTVLGDVNNLINWITPSDLGTISNGTVSELYVKAKSQINKPLTYKLYDHKGISCRLPQGLSLLPSGEISGRVSFEAFNLDGYSTTFDKGKLTIDRTYNFAIVAETTDGSSSAIQQFTLKLEVVDKIPYENLYLKAMPELDQRQIYKSVIENTEIFNTSLIYRPTDPYYGVQKDMRMLFIPGLTPSDLKKYQDAMLHNHYTKTYSFGDIKSAVVLDENYNVKYEVVYIEIVDPKETDMGTGPGVELNLNGTIANPYSGTVKPGNDPKIIYPNTSENMMKRLEDNIGYQDQSSLPSWMTSNQPDPNSANKFQTPLGYTKAVVMAYTVPGAGQLIAYRLKNTGINFNRIQFMVDRYLLDNFYSTYFITDSKTYKRGKETTFDTLTGTNAGKIIASVTYAVTKPFSEINGRPLSYVNDRGGIDGSKTYFDGDTIIFAKQENFINPPPYEGWINYKDLYIGDNIGTKVIEGYDSELYDDYDVIPGFLEKSQDIASVVVSATTTSATNKQLTVSSTKELVVGMPIKFTGSLVGGLVENTDYYIATIVDDTHIILSYNSDLTDIIPLSNGAGTMTGRVVVNKRGGIWRVNLVNDIINLTFLREVELGQRVRILEGKTYASAILFYSINLAKGQSVPFYEVFKQQGVGVLTKTTFNNNSTRFFNYRDQYYEPGTKDKYVKFPQYGEFY